MLQQTKQNRYLMIHRMSHRRRRRRRRRHHRFPHLFGVWLISLVAEAGLGLSQIAQSCPLAHPWEIVQPNSVDQTRQLASVKPPTWIFLLEQVVAFQLQFPRYQSLEHLLPERILQWHLLHCFKF